MRHPTLVNLNHIRKSANTVISGRRGQYMYYDWVVQEEIDLLLDIIQAQQELDAARALLDAAMNTLVEFSGECPRMWTQALRCVEKQLDVVKVYQAKVLALTTPDAPIPDRFSPFDWRGNMEYGDENAIRHSWLCTRDNSPYASSR